MNLMSWILLVWAVGGTLIIAAAARAEDRRMEQRVDRLLDLWAGVDETEELWSEDQPEDDICPGHYSVTGDLIYCGLPYGHRGVSELYDQEEDDEF